MSIDAAQASRFYEQVAKDGVVFTLEDDGNFLVFPIKGSEVIPFWSSRSHAEKVKTDHPKFSACDVAESTLAEFLEKTLPLLEEEGIHVGVNWSGARLSGFDLPVKDLLANLQYWLDKEAKH